MTILAGSSGDMRWRPMKYVPTERVAKKDAVVKVVKDEETARENSRLKEQLNQAKTEKAILEAKLAALKSKKETANADNPQDSVPERQSTSGGEAGAQTTGVRRRGRPRGSTNKPSTATT